MSPRARRPALAALLLALILAASCARPPGPLGPEPAAPRLWKAFKNPGPAATKTDAPFLAKASLYYTDERKTNRMRVEFWGRRGRALRLDISASIGTPLAFFRESPARWLAFYPRERRAYLHTDAATAFAALDMRIPFSLDDLALLVMGRADRLAPESYDSFAPAPDNGWTYHFGENARIGSLTLSVQGVPTAMAGTGTAPWTMELSRTGSPGPARSPGLLDLRTQDGHRARLLVKKVDERTVPWPEKALSLELPPGVPATLQGG